MIFKGSGFYCTDYKKPSLDKKVERAKEASKDVNPKPAKSSSSGGSDSNSTSAA